LTGCCKQRFSIEFFAVDTLMAGKLLDTTALVDLSRGNIAAADYVDEERRKGVPLFVSVVSAMELIVEV
jgi:hypothetical protein